ncbi:MAG TPA: TylF/MycF/NovP-related O-methyltransferase [Bacteroidota bacterium]|nr:TylF/MycF/NovP-related O-methyltransferase [Bacteroidota bacterium]
MFKPLVKYLWDTSHRFSARLHVYIVRSLAYDDQASHCIDAGHDYVRIKTLELCRRTIIEKNVSGCTAELGVYKGHFAAKINELFPNRRLYLFDTFEGFDRLDRMYDAQKNFSKLNDDFSDTNIDQVRRGMKYPEQCVFVKGRFPDSARGIDDTFSFVSLDADLYLPTKYGLDYFYPRLEKNGYLFVHDYFNRHYKGVKKAVDEFCDIEHANMVPIPDLAGSVIITK